MKKRVVKYTCGDEGETTGPVPFSDFNSLPNNPRGVTLEKSEAEGFY